jgi:predicted MFS family arabinose efflux permease
VTSLDLRSPFVLLRRHRDLRLLLGAQVVSMAGDWILGIGLAYAVYDLTGSTVASALTLLSGFVPMVVVGLVAGVFVDRWDRKRTMVTTHVLLALGLIPLLFVTGPEAIGLVYVVMAVESVLEVFFAPAEQALLPRLVPDEDLVAANGLNAQARNVARLVGGALGGIVVAAGGLPALAVVDAATFLVAALLVRRIATSGAPEPAPTVEAEATVVVRGQFAALAEEWKAGLRATWQHPAVRVLVVFTLITSTGEGIMGTLFAPYVRDVLDGSSTQYGLISGIQAVGGVLGGFAVVSVAHRWSPTLMLWAGSLVFGAVDLAIFLYPLLLVSVWPALLGMTLVGIPGAIVQTGLRTLLQRNTLDAERGRVFSLQNLAMSVMLMAGATAAGFLGEAVGIMPILALQGVAYLVAGLMVLAALPRLEPALDLAATRP